jgi:hypothetical protein
VWEDNDKDELLTMLLSIPTSHGPTLPNLRDFGARSPKYIKAECHRDSSLEKEFRHPGDEGRRSLTKTRFFFQIKKKEGMHAPELQRLEMAQCLQLVGEHVTGSRTVH